MAEPINISGNTGPVFILMSNEIVGEGNVTVTSNIPIHFPVDNVTTVLLLAVSHLLVDCDWTLSSGPRNKVQQAQGNLLLLLLLLLLPLLLLLLILLLVSLLLGNLQLIGATVFLLV